MSLFFVKIIDNKKGRPKPPFRILIKNSYFLTKVSLVTPLAVATSYK